MGSDADLCMHLARYQAALRSKRTLFASEVTPVILGKGGQEVRGTSRHAKGALARESGIAKANRPRDSLLPRAPRPGIALEVR